MNRLRHILFAAALIFATTSFSIAADSPPVKTFRLPDGGVQPQAGVDDKGIVHLIYMTGDPSNSDIFYIRSADGGQTFSKPTRVNLQPGGAMAIGTVRGAHMAIGTGGQVHVAWMGSKSATPNANPNDAPMLYTHSSRDGASFEPQRNLIDSHYGLNGGGSIAADDRGNVFVAWHAPLHKGDGEESRRVWLVRSADGGKTFASEEAISGDGGACGCCGMRLLSADGSIYALFRTAERKIERDMTLIRLDRGATDPRTDTVGKMQSAICVMSTAALVVDPRGGAIGAWETNGQIFWARLKLQGSLPEPIAAPGRQRGRKHPALATNSAGQVLLAWAEGTGWNQGGSVAWQVFDETGKPIEGAAGRGERLPVWGSPAAFTAKDGSFVVVY